MEEAKRPEVSKPEEDSIAETGNEDTSGQKNTQQRPGLKEQRMSEKIAEWKWKRLRGLKFLSICI